MIQKINDYFIWLVFIVLLLLSAVFRIQAYGDPGISIGTVDSPVFISSAQADLTYHFLETGRPPTVPLFYKLLQPVSGYLLTAISQPSARDGDKELQMQPGLERVAWGQMLFSIAGWSVLALVIFNRLRNTTMKFMAAIAVLAFAYSPQLAEWDRIILSESISFSLFALLFALTIELAFRLAEDRTSSRIMLYIIGCLWLVVFILWVFTRDANSYLIPVTVSAGLLTILIPAVRRKMNVYFIAGLIILLSLTFYVQQNSMRASQRWILPFLTNISVNVLPYPDRVEFFKTMGMPITEELMQLQSSMGGEAGFYEIDTFMEWAVQDGMSDYMRFLMEYPLWAATKLYNDLELLFSENLQPWFTGPADSHPLWLIRIGDMFHTKSSGTILLSVILTFMVVLMAIRSKEKRLLIWAWIAGWFLLGEMVLLFISYHGDARSIIRHTLVATMPLRLSVWLLIMLVVDIAYSQMKPTSAKSKMKR